jgi:periplasmic protein TonB
MSAARLDRPDLRVWIAGGALALALHASFALKLVQWHDPVPGDNGNEAVLVDLAPLMAEPQAQTQDDLAPGPLQQEAPALPEPPKEQPQQRTEETIEPLPTVPNAEAVLPKPEARPVEAPKPKPVQPPAPVTTAPPRPHPSAAQVWNWHRQIAIALQRHKGYPAAAQARRETGVATVSFTIDRQGKVVSARIVRTSQHAALDAETLATVHRAAPFPHPPANMPGQTFDFVVPVQFNIR